MSLIVKLFLFILFIVVLIEAQHDYGNNGGFDFSNNYGKPNGYNDLSSNKFYGGGFSNYGLGYNPIFGYGGAKRYSSYSNNYGNYGYNNGNGLSNNYGNGYNNGFSSGYENGLNRYYGLNNGNINSLNKDNGNGLNNGYNSGYENSLNYHNSGLNNGYMSSLNNGNRKGLNNAYRGEGLIAPAYSFSSDMPNYGLLNSYSSRISPYSTSSLFQQEQQQNPCSALCAAYIGNGGGYEAMQNNAGNRGK